MAIISPDRINAHVENLVGLMGSKEIPLIVPVKVMQGAKIGNCYFNVRDKIAAEGGDIQYGWVIWISNILCEAEHHAVWKNKEGALIDITPKEDSMANIMFLPDDAAIYKNVPIDNYRINISGRDIVDDFIKISACVSKLYQYCPQISDEQVHVPADVVPYLEKYSRFKDRILEFIYRGKDEKSKCFCNVKKTYRSCHGKNLDERIERDINIVAAKIKS
jgi:hypothetical protein